MLRHDAQIASAPLHTALSAAVIPLVATGSILATLANVSLWSYPETMWCILQVHLSVIHFSVFILPVCVACVIFMSVLLAIYWYKYGESVDCAFNFRGRSSHDRRAKIVSPESGAMSSVYCVLRAYIRIYSIRHYTHTRKTFKRSITVSQSLKFFP